LNRNTPVPDDDLKPNTADPSRLGARCTIVDRRNGQKPPCLRAVLRLLRQTPQPCRTEIFPKQYRHDEPPSFATLNQNPVDLGIAEESHFRELGISRHREAR
jgi:hypothetical protein